MQVFEKWRLTAPYILDIDILNYAQSKINSETHWLKAKLVLADEAVIALGYVVVVVYLCGFGRYMSVLSELCNLLITSVPPGH